MAKEQEQEQPTLQKEIAGLLKEKEFVLHCIDITSSTEYFNKVNDMVLDVLMQIADAQKVDEEREQFKEMFRQHFHEIKLLRELYDNLKS